MTTTTKNNLLFFWVLVLLSVLLGEMAIYFLEFNQLIYKDLSEQLTLQQLEEFFKEKAKWAWLGYVAVPIILFLKITVVAWVLAVGGFFNDIELPHRKYFGIVLFAEFVFLVPALLKIVWFYFFETDFTLAQVQQFVPFSIQSVVDTGNIPIWALYPLQLLNLFEVIYWVLLAILLNKVAKTQKGIKTVFTSYAPALLLWIVFIMFLSLNMTP